jgi:hypothetical protein
MIKALRVTSIIAAVLAAGLFAFPAAFGFRSGEEIEQFLSLPGVVEKYRQERGSKPPGREDQISPLVAQAKAFGKYLNPPKTPKLPKKIRTSRDTKVTVVEPPSPPPRPRVSAKFKVIATSYCESHPELSLALIDEPAKGRHWVRESAVVSHLTIEHIKDGLVVVKGTRGTSEIATEARPPRRNLLAGSSPVSPSTSSQIAPKPTPTSVSPEDRPAAGAGADAISSELEQMSAEEQAALAEKIFSELEAMLREHEGQNKFDKTDSEHSTKESTAETEKYISDLEAMRISGKEAKKLGHLGQELKETRKEVEQDPNQTKSPKTEGASKKQWKPRKPRKSSTSTSKPSERTKRKRP